MAAAKTQRGKCVVFGCNRAQRSKHMCLPHYKRQQNGNTSQDPLRTDKICAVETCNKVVRTSYELPLCKPHRFRRHSGDLRPVIHYVKDTPCRFPGCKNLGRTLGLCVAHYRQHWLYGEDNLKPIREPTYRLISSNGYVQLWEPGHSEAMKSGWALEHRIVMAEYLGRPLLKEENVHHKNGDREDNRLKNLELWNVSQPAGQRVEDKLEWAEHIIALYKKSEKIRKLRKVS